MPELEDGWVVTGSSGFIGTHLCAALTESIRGIDVEAPRAEAAHGHVGADIRRLEPLREIAAAERVHTLFHLAASAEVLTPWPEIAQLLSSNLDGTYNVLEAFGPRLMIFASSSSVYGSAGLRPVDTSIGAIQPLCLYAVSKLAGEMTVRDWVRERGGSAVIFRFGNVVGTGCRGLIPYLAAHVKRYPDGRVPARLRGAGRLVRDYVPVDYVVRVMLAAAQAEWAPQSLVTLNLGAGRGMTNREVAEVVQQVAAASGYRLELTFDDPPGPGEADAVVLDMEETVELFGIAPPGPAEVRRSIAEAAQEELSGARAARGAGSAA